MRLLTCSTAIGILCCSVAAAQAPGAIAGVVVDRNNSPIRKAYVTLSTVEPKPQDALAWTDANGRFSFSYLSPGPYRLMARKDGYDFAVFGATAPRRPGATIQLAAGEIRADIVFRLQPPSSISGVVLDEDGDPVRYVQVMVLTRGFPRGKRAFQQGQTAVTDETGHYRLDLVPGKYVIMASVQNHMARKIRPEVSAGDPQLVNLVGSQFYPGVASAESATLLTVQPGQELTQIDFRLSTFPAISVSGRVLIPPGTPADGVSVTMMRDGPGLRLTMGSGTQPPVYTFQIQQLTSGSYKILATATIAGKKYRATQSLVLASEGVSDLVIPLDPPIDLSGTVTVEGPDAAEHPVSTVALTPGDDLPASGALQGNDNKDGTFKSAAVPAGIWDIGPSPITGGYIKSMRLGDLDVLTEDMVISPSTTAKLKIVMGTKAAVLEGDILKGDQPARAVALLVPAEKFRHVAAFYRWIGSDDKGHFEMKGVRPGDYKLFAVEEIDPRTVQDPEFLKPIEASGVAVTLREGTNEKQKLTVIR